MSTAGREKKKERASLKSLKDENVNRPSNSALLMWRLLWHDTRLLTTSRLLATMRFLKAKDAKWIAGAGLNKPSCWDSKLLSVLPLQRKRQLQRANSTWAYTRLSSTMSSIIQFCKTSLQLKSILLATILTKKRLSQGCEPTVVSGFIHLISLMRSNIWSYITTSVLSKRRRFIQTFGKFRTSLTSQTRKTSTSRWQ